MHAPWPRPVPTVGDCSSAAERGADPSGWAWPEPARRALEGIMASRRDIRRFRPDPVPADLLQRVLTAAHRAPSVGHSQPWRFVVVTDPAARARAAVLADRARLAQAALMEPDAGRHLLDLDLEGIREAPLGLVVCCDRRVDPAGVLGRATFPDADMWSCACAIQNLWLAARAEGLGVGWVTLFRPDDLSALVAAPPGVETLGWLCLGWPDERPPAPGLERRGWSERAELASVVIRESWPAEDGSAPARPRSRLLPPDQRDVVGARDGADVLLTPGGSLGILDRCIDKVQAVRPSQRSWAGGHMVIAAADHPVAALGVSAYPVSVTRTVAEATALGVSVGAVAAAQAGLEVVLVDAGVSGPPVAGAVHLRPSASGGDLLTTDALSEADLDALVEGGLRLGRSLGSPLCALGEVGVGNTTVAAALAAALLDADAQAVVGLGAASDSLMVATKRKVVSGALARLRASGRSGPRAALCAVGGPEVAVLTGVVLGAAAAGSVVVLDGLATSVAALAAVSLEPAVAAHLVAGQRSREVAHAAVLGALGLEPLLDLRLRAGEGAGAAMAVGLLRAGLAVREGAARTGAR